MKKLLLVSLLVLGVFASPNLSIAETTSEVIARLLAQIQVLQTQLLQLQAQQSGGFCYSFSRNMGVGVSGPDVAALRSVLNREGFNIPKISSGMAESEAFTESFAAAVSSFQLKYKSEILTPNGLTAPTGYVGVATRAKLNALYGCRYTSPVENQTPVISGVSGPTVLKVGETGTWTIRASDPENGVLDYRVMWGDDVTAPMDITPLPKISPVQQTSTFTHVYNKTGVYSLTFVVSDWLGETVRSSISVNVTQNGQDITVLTPNGGEQWEALSHKMIRWGYKNLPSTSKVDLYLNPKLPDCVFSNIAPCLVAEQVPYLLDKNIAINGGYNWIVATDIVNNPIPAGNYYMRICQAGNTTNCDQSDQPFTIFQIIAH